MINLPTSKKVDIMIIAEGTYPYVRGGVSSWIYQLISGLQHYSFGVIFIGSQAKDYEEIKYDFPQNLKHVEIHYLFENKKHNPKRRKGNKKAFESLQNFFHSMELGDYTLPKEMRGIDFFYKGITMKDFLYSKESWNLMTQEYEQKCPDIPFIDYVWTLRNMFAPIWKIADIVKNMPKTKIIHSPSTGYAGFLATLASNDKNVPFIVTEHGIYTRERKIDMLSAQWISYHTPKILQNEPEEMNFIKQLWVEFFEKLAKMSYHQANYITSLYSEMREVQLACNIDKDKTLTIPNGINMKHLNTLVDKRTSSIPKVVTLIGRVVSIKDIKTFIRAIAITQKSIPKIEGWVIGPTDEEIEYAQECFDLVTSLGLESNISFLGFQNIDDVLPKSGLLTLTSISEGMPLVILEGFAAGVPCVSTDVGSCRSLIYGSLDEEDIAIGKAGEITTIANPNKLAEHYIAFLTDELRWKNAQKNALKRVERYYQDSLFFKSYDMLYKELL